MGESNLGDSANRIPAPCRVGVPDHAKPRDGRAKCQQAQQARDELRRVVGFSAADEIEKLDRLKKAGSTTDAEFSRLRAKLVQ